MLIKLPCSSSHLELFSISIFIAGYTIYDKCGNNYRIKKNIVIINKKIIMLIMNIIPLIVKDLVRVEHLQFFVS